MAGLLADRCLETGFGIRQIPPVQGDHAEVVPRIGVRGGQGHGPAEVGDRPVLVPLMATDQAPIGRCERLAAATCQEVFAELCQGLDRTGRPE